MLDLVLLFSNLKIISQITLPIPKIHKWIIIYRKSKIMTWKLTKDYADNTKELLVL